MILIKRTSAWDELSELVTRDESNGLVESELYKLHDAILDADKTDALDNVVSDEYPAGVEPEELEDFFKDEQEFILEQLGITLSDDDEEYGDDEENEDEYNDNSDD